MTMHRFVTRCLVYKSKLRDVEMVSMFPMHLPSRPTDVSDFLGIKTVIPNMSDIAKALNVDPDCMYLLFCGVFWGGYFFLLDNKNQIRPSSFLILSLIIKIRSDQVLWHRARLAVQIRQGARRHCERRARQLQAV